MDTTVLDCRGVAAEFRGWASSALGALERSPCLAAVLFRPQAHAASVRYRDLILKDARGLGVEALSLEPENREGLLKALEELNRDPRVTGVVVFYPLGSGLVDEDVMDLVSPAKDVEGLHSVNLGYLIKYKRFLDEARTVKCVVPATAKAVVKTLQRYPAIRLEGAFVAIVNNSMRVGKPLGLMLENLGATVVKCYALTPPSVLEDCVRRADLVITAVPASGFALDPAWVKPGAAVVDVSFQGNVDAAALRGRASHMTEPGNGVGQVTRAMMLVNLVYCAHLGEASRAGLRALP